MDKVVVCLIWVICDKFRNTIWNVLNMMISIIKAPSILVLKRTSLSVKKGDIHRRVVQAPILLESIFCLTLRLLPPYHVSWGLMTSSGWKQNYFSNPSFLAYPVKYKSALTYQICSYIEILRQIFRRNCNLF